MAGAEKSTKLLGFQSNGELTLDPAELRTQIITFYL
jgi:hypothetical protein